MTNDTRIAFHAANAECAAAPDAFILETKSAKGNGIAENILRAEHLHPTKNYSKYCVGMAALGIMNCHNRFLPALGKLHLAKATPALADGYRIAA